jgi:O-antigen ligase
VRDYADIMAAFTSRYRGQIDFVQVWNEPNLSEEWGRLPVDAAAYVELLRAGFEGARRGNANVVVVAASLAQTLEPEGSAAGLDDLAYLDRMYSFGAAPFFDRAAANAYGLWTGPDDRQVGGAYTNLSRLLLVREVMARHGDAAKPLWVSEFGWNAEPIGWDGRPSPWGRVDEATQSAWLRAGWHRAGREWPWLSVMSAWLMRQPRPLADDPTQFFALVRPDWSGSIAYDALVAETQRPVLGPGTWPDDAQGIEYVGTWQVSEKRSPSGGSLRETPAPNAHMRLRFEGTRIALLAPVGPQRGVAYVTVDGSYVLAGLLPRNRYGQAMIDFGDAVARDSVRFPVASGLPDGVHTLEVTVSGDAGTGSSDAGVGIDGVVIARDRSGAPETILGVAWAVSIAVGAFSVRRSVEAQVAMLAGKSRTFALLAGNPSPYVGALPVGEAIRVWPVLITVAALPLASLAVQTPAGRFSPVELIALGALVAGTLGALIATGASPRAALRPYREVRPPRLSDLEPEHWAALLIAVGGTVGAMVATYPTPAWREWRLLVAEPVAWFVVARSVVRDETRARWCAVALVCGGSVAGLVAVVQAATGMGVVEAEGVGRAVAFSTSPNNLALLLGRTFPLAVALAITRPEHGHRAARGWAFASWAAVALVGSGLAVTWSRGGWAAGAIAGAWVVWRATTAVAAPAPALPVGSHPLLRRRVDHPPLRASALGVADTVGGDARLRSADVKRQLRWWWLGATVVLTGVFATLGAVALAPSRVRSILDTDGSGLLRVSVWKSAVAMILDHPWFGIGLDQFVYAYPRYLQADAWREPNLSHPHQFVLDAWLRLGVFGVGAIIALWWGVWSREAIARDTVSREARPRSSLQHGATGALLAIVGHGLVDNSYFVIDLVYSTWAIVLIHRCASPVPLPSPRR